MRINSTIPINPIYDKLLGYCLQENPYKKPEKIDNIKFHHKVNPINLSSPSQNQYSNYRPHYFQNKKKQSIQVYQKSLKNLSDSKKHIDILA